MAISAVAALVSTGVTALTSGVTSLIGASIFTHFLVTTAMGAALNALTPKPTVSRSGGYTLQGQSGAALDHQIIYGETRVGGVRLFDVSTGGENKYLHRIIAFAGHEIDSFQQIYLNDQVVTINGSDEVTFPNRYDGNVRIKTYLGTDNQQADGELISATRDLSDSAGKWTSEHRLQGIAYIYVRFKYDENAFPNGVPSVSAVIRGKKVFNPNTNTTAWSENPALCIRDYLTSDYGLNQPSSRIDDDLITTAASICNQTVGDEKRYTCNGTFITGAEPSTILNDLLTSMGGLLWYGQGKWRVKAATWTEPTVSFDEDDLRSGISLSTRHSRRDNFNSVKGTFKGPQTDYQPADYPIVDSDTYLATDGGVVNTLDLPLPFTDSSNIARRIAQIALNRNREQLTFSAAFGMRAFQVQVGDFININNERFGWTNKAFEVTEWNFGLTEGLDIQVRMTLREISAGVFTAGVEKNFEGNNTTLPDPFEIIPPGISIDDELRIVNEQVTGVILVELTSANNLFEEYFEVEYKKSDATRWVPVGKSNSTLFEILSVSDGFFDIRARSVNTLGIRSNYSTVSNWYVNLFAPPPSTVENFTGNVVGNSLHLTWSAVPDLDLSHYRIRYAKQTTGASYQDAIDLITKVARPAVSVTVPAKTGTYFIRAVDKLGNVSQTTSSFVVQTNIDSLEDLNLIQTLTENPSFTGSKTNVVKLEDYLTLDTTNLFDSTSDNFDVQEGLFDGGGADGAIASSGIYQFSNYVDLGARYLSRVKIDLEIFFINYADTFDVATGDFDSRDGDFDGDPSKFDLTSVTAQVSYTNDNPAGSPTWSDWQNIVVSDISARAIRFRVVLESSSAKVAPAITTLVAKVDMPDRLESGSDLTYTGSRVITFPVAFKDTPAIGISAILANGDRYVISAKSRSGFTITTLTGASTSTNPTTIDYVAKGYGRETA
jgi:hypothetical protein